MWPDNYLMSPTTTMVLPDDTIDPYRITYYVNTFGIDGSVFGKIIERFYVKPPMSSKFPCQRRGLMPKVLL